MTCEILLEFELFDFSLQTASVSFIVCYFALYLKYFVLLQCQVASLLNNISIYFFRFANIDKVSLPRFADFGANSCAA